MLYDYDYCVERVDQEPIDNDWDVYPIIEYNEVSSRYEMCVSLLDIKKCYGDLILKIEHIPTGQVFEKIVKVLEHEESNDYTPSLPPSVPDLPTISPVEPPVEKPTEMPTVRPTEVPTEMPTERPTVNPTETPTVTPTQKPVKPAKITLNQSSVTLYTVGQTTASLSATVTGPEKKVTYTSSKPGVVKVSKNGVLTAVSAGTAVITASANGVKATCKVVVKKPVLKVGKTSITLKPGKKGKIQVTSTPVNKMTFSSNKTSIASVDRYGTIIAKKRGTATITIRCNGLKKTVKVVVK